jgi:hypothetical protein
VLQIPAGSYAFFPKDTVLDLQLVKAKKVETLLDLATPSEFEIVGQLTQADLIAAVEVIRISPVVERGLKKRCCR